MVMTLPDKFYDEIVQYFMEHNSASAEEQLEHFNSHFPEAIWYYNDDTNNIYPVFKSPEHKTMFALKWS